MKFRSSWWKVLPATALVLGACGKKEVEETKKAAEEAVEKAVEVVTGETPAPAVTALTPGERAAMLGIVGRLSKDTESVMAIYDGKEIVNRLRGLKIWEFIRETAKEEGGTDPEAEIAAGAEEASKFLGQEFFFATGKGTAPQLANLNEVSRRMNYHQFRFLTKAFVEGLQDGNLDGLNDPEANQAWMLEWVKDMAKNAALVDSVAFPPLLAGIKAADADSLGQAQQGLSSSLEFLPSMLGEAAAPVEFTKGGVEFKGYKLSGSALAGLMEQGRAELEQQIDKADLDRLLAALKEKNLVLSVGTLDDYLLAYIGGSEEDCPLVETVEDSLAANDGISFVDGSKGKKVVGLLYGDEGLMKASVTNSLKDMTDGIRDGIAGVEGLGDTRDLLGLLDLVGEKETALLSLYKTDTLGGLVVLEEGVKFELFGGLDSGAVDYGATRTLFGLGGGEETLFFANWVVDAECDKRSMEFLTVLFESAYALTEKVAGFEVEDVEEFAQFQQGFMLFNEKFRTDLAGVWQGIVASNEGLGKEVAMVVDLKGGVPPIPGAPQELVDEGKFVRASLVSPVVDRPKLAEGWQKIDGSLRNLLKTVSEMSGQEIPMQKPVTSERNGLINYGFAMPFFNDDFWPSVTVGDKWYVASTSKLQAFDLVATAEAAPGEGKGAVADFDFDVLRKFATDWIALVDKHGEKVVPDSDQLARFREELPRIRKGIAALEELDDLSYNQRREGDKTRVTLHFKVR